MLGEKVAVLTRTKTGEDEMGEPVYRWEAEEVDGVLVRSIDGAETSSSDTASNLRPDGVRVTYSLAFPKSWTSEKPFGYLEHARVALIARGMDENDADGALRVSGHPDRTPESPISWDTVAEVGRMDG